MQQGRLGSGLADWSLAIREGYARGQRIGSRIKVSPGRRNLLLAEGFVVFVEVEAGLEVGFRIFVG